MKAAVIEEPGRLVVREVAEPIMGDYDCLCQGLYGATCSGTDLHLLANHPLFGIQYPTLRNFRVGDIVTRLCHRQVVKAVVRLSDEA